MPTTIKSTETPELELVSVAEDASVQSDEQLLDNVETSDTVSEEVVQADSVI